MYLLGYQTKLNQDVVAKEVFYQNLKNIRMFAFLKTMGYEYVPVLRPILPLTEMT